MSVTGLIDADNDYVHVSPFTEPSKGASPPGDLDDRHSGGTQPTIAWRAFGGLRSYLGIGGGETDSIVSWLFFSFFDNVTPFCLLDIWLTALPFTDHHVGTCSILT